MPTSPDSFKDRLDYIRRLFAPETPVLTAIRQSTTSENDQISIHPEEGKLLQLLIRLGNVKKIVEIGTLGGYSATWMADALPGDGFIISIERDDARFSLAQRNLTENNKVKLVHGDALKELPEISKLGPFDMAFIDADKLHYLHYLDWAEKNIRTGGLIIGDNTFLFDAVWREEMPERVRATARAAMRAFNERLANPEKYTAVLLPTEAGMTIAQKKF